MLRLKRLMSLLGWLGRSSSWFFLGQFAIPLFHGGPARKANSALIIDFQAFHPDIIPNLHDVCTN